MTLKDTPIDISVINMMNTSQAHDRMAVVEASYEEKLMLDFEIIIDEPVNKVINIYSVWIDLPKSEQGEKLKKTENFELIINIIHPA